MAKEFTVEQLQALMKSVAENNLGELSFEAEGCKVKIKNWMMAPSHGIAGQPAAPVCEAEPVPVPAAASPRDPVCPEEGRYLTSPIVGTFYAASSPDKEAFASVGQMLREGDTAYIVESMKVMNEVPADFGGVVAEILVESGEPVEYGQKIMRLE